MSHRVVRTLVLILGFPLALRGQATDPLWSLAQSHLLKSHTLVASEVAVHIELFDADGKPKFSADQRYRLTAWKNGEPVRTVVSMTSSEKGPVDLPPVDLGLAKHPDRAFENIVGVERLEESALDARLCVVFRVSGKLKTMPFTGKAWIEKGTGLPVRLDCTYDSSSLPMTKALSTSVTFGPDADGRWLPKKMVFDLLISAFFTKARMLVSQEAGDWIARP